MYYIIQHLKLFLVVLSIALIVAYICTEYYLITKLFNRRRSLSRKILFTELKDINKSKQNIFFIESRCTLTISKEFKDNKKFILNARQCCAIESTALTNPTRDIYIFYSCPLSNDFVYYSPLFVRKMFKYSNVNVVKFNLSEVLQGSSVEEIYEKGLIQNSTFPVEHSSDILRLVLLWKFGGTYCDLDVVTIRSISPLKTNWVGVQDEQTIANGVLNFEAGHKIIQSALKAVSKNFDGESWSANGPILLTSSVLEECGVDSIPEAMTNCSLVTIFNSSVLYPLYYSQYPYLFDDPSGPGVVALVTQSAYSVHTYSKLSHNSTVTVGSSQAYALLAEQFCPHVYYRCGRNF